MNNNIENNICEAIDILVSKAVENAGYDKTIKATIVKQVDASIGKYQCKYQDSLFYAYADNLETTYNNDIQVYVVIPNNDFTNSNKRIVGSVNKLGIDYVAGLTEEDMFNTTGEVLYKSNEEYGLCSYKSRYVRLDITNTSETFKDTLEDCEYLKVSFNVKTALPVEQQLKGTYGLKITLLFQDEGTEETYSYTYDFSNLLMQGTVYSFPTKTKQTYYFKLKGKVQSINADLVAYSTDFPNRKRVASDDIWISDIEIYGANKITEDELSGYSLSLLTPQGTKFLSNEVSKYVKAQVRYKGSVVNATEQNIRFFWYKEDFRVDTASEYYNSSGGKGWKCLNERVKSNEGDNAIVDWAPADESLTISKSQCTSQINWYKCVAKIGDTVVSKTFSIKVDEIENRVITISSDSGTKFAFSVGSPTLRCDLGTDISFNSNLEVVDYYWGRENSDGSYDIVQHDHDPLYVSTYKVDLATEVDYKTTFKCAVYGKLKDGYYKVIDDDYFIGVGEITIINSQELVSDYRLVINGGEQTFLYDTDGVAPTSEINMNPQVITPLTFSFYDADGNTIYDGEKPTDEMTRLLRSCSWHWIAPVGDSMLNISFVSPYDNDLPLNFSISPTFNREAKNNSIQLEFTYKNEKIYRAETKFNFIKQGESGTNGSKISCKIMPSYKVVGEPPIMRLYDRDVFDFNFTSLTVAYYENGARKYGTWIDENIDIDKIEWKIMKNKYSSTSKGVEDPTFLSFRGESKGSTVYLSGSYNATPYNYDYLRNLYDNRLPFTYLASCVQVMIPLKDGQVLYDVCPITTIVKYQNATREVELEYGTGYNQVLYNSEGVLPQYDNKGVFKFKNNLNDGELLQYYLNSNIYQLVDKQYVKKDLELFTFGESFSVVNKYLPELKATVYPPKAYDGECLTCGITAYMYDSNTSRGADSCMYIPIYMLLNRYGLASLNAWDGNQISISEDGGYILAPQIGAGKKESVKVENDFGFTSTYKNVFSGVVMGRVKEADRSTEDIGLVGYAKGERSLFINAETGGALFGKNNGGRITIDPYNGSKIYSKNFYTDDSYQENGFLIDKPTESQKEGMLIDFDAPAIRFGSGAFSVDSDGYITAKGGGTISGWRLGYSKPNTGIKSEEDINNYLCSAWTGSAPEGSGTSVGDKVNYATYLVSRPLAKDSTQLYIPKEKYFLKGQTITEGPRTGEVVTEDYVIVTSEATLNSDKLQIGLKKDITFQSGFSGFVDGGKGVDAKDKKDFESRVFTVNREGDFTAHSGTIGLWNFNQNSISTTATTKSYKMEFKNSSESGGDVLNTTGLFIGNTNSEQYTKITMNGLLTTTYAKLGGWTVGKEDLVGTSSTNYLSPTGILNFGDYKINSNADEGGITFGKVNSGTNAVNSYFRLRTSDPDVHLQGNTLNLLSTHTKIITASGASGGLHVYAGGQNLENEVLWAGEKENSKYVYLANKVTSNSSYCPLEIKNGGDKSNSYAFFKAPVKMEDVNLTLTNGTVYAVELNASGTIRGRAGLAITGGGLTITDKTGHITTTGNITSSGTITGADIKGTSSITGGSITGSTGLFNSTLTIKGGIKVYNGSTEYTGITGTFTDVTGISTVSGIVTNVVTA